MPVLVYAVASLVRLAYNEAMLLAPGWEIKLHFLSETRDIVAYTNMVAYTNVENPVAASCRLSIRLVDSR